MFARRLLDVCSMFAGSCKRGISFFFIIIVFIISVQYERSDWLINRTIGVSLRLGCSHTVRIRVRVSSYGYSSV